MSENVKSNRSFWIAFAFCTVAAHYSIFEFTQSQRLKFEIELLQKKEKIDNDQIRDLMYSLQDQKSNNEMVKAQGYVAGILDGIKHEDHYMTIWHDGYNRGSEVRQQVAEAFLGRSGKDDKIIEVESEKKNLIEAGTKD